jgi:hypothetical protein
MKNSFITAMLQEFRINFKRDFYAYAYGSYKGELALQDFESMYLMGGEL